LKDGEFDKQKCTQKIRILPGLTKKQRIDKSNDDELDKFYCSFYSDLRFRFMVWDFRFRG